MAEPDRNENGIVAIGDEELEAVAGGANFVKCDRKIYEAAFPEKKCKGCQHLVSWIFQDNFGYQFECKFFNKSEHKEKDLWGLYQGKRMK